MALALVLAAALAWRLRPAPRRAVEAAAGDGPAVGTAAPARHVPRLIGAAAPPPPAAAPAADPPGETGPGKRYMRLYNGQSGRLRAGATFQMRHGPHRMSSADLPVAIWMTRNEVDPGETTTLVAQASDPAAVLEGAVAEFRAGGVAERVPMIRAADGSLTADFHPGPALAAALAAAEGPKAAPVLVDAVADVEVRRGGATARGRVVTMFSVQDGGATIVLGSERIELGADGNAHLGFDVEVRRPGDFHAYAELWSPARGVSLAFGRKNIGTLAPGRHRLELLFGGQVIRDSGIDGPYAVRNLELLRVTPRLPHLAHPVAELMITPAWRATEFH